MPYLLRRNLRSVGGMARRVLLAFGLSCAAEACFFSIADVRQQAGTGGAGGMAGSSGFAGSGGCAMQASADAAACAACDHDCLGGACLLGQCQPFALATTPPRAVALTLDVDDVYWSASDGIYRTAKIGGTEWFKKVTDASAPTALVVDEQWVYFADAAGSRIAKVEKAGGFAQVVVSVEGPFALALEGSVLYYGSSVGKVFSVSTDGTGVRELASLAATRPEAIWDIWLGQTDLVFGDSDARGVFAVAKDGSTSARQLSKTTRDVFGVTGDSLSLFFREGDESIGVLAEIPSSGTRVDALMAEASPAGVTCDRAFVYFVAGAGGSTIRRYERATKQVTTVADGRLAARSLRVDDTALYFTEAGSGAVLKLAK